MAKKVKAPAGSRMLKCSVSGVEFAYSGRGRPPKYCPAVKAELLKAQQSKARERQKAKTEGFAAAA